MKITNDVEVRESKITTNTNVCMWQLENKSVAWIPYSNQEGREAHLNATIGSLDESMCFPNEMRFGSNDYALLSASLYVPEETLTASQEKIIRTILADVEEINSSIMLLKSARNFRFELAKYVFYKEDVDILYGVSDFVLTNAESTKILYIDKEFGLIFSKEHLSGWCLKNASAKMFLGYSQTSDSNKQNARLLEAYFSVFNSKNMSKMDDEDESVKLILNDILNKMKNGCFDGSNAHVLEYMIELVENALDFYYSIPGE